MTITCDCCRHCECHGYPPEGTPEWIAFTVYMVCGLTHGPISPWDTCDSHEWGEPSIVRDDADTH